MHVQLFHVLPVLVQKSRQKARKGAKICQFSVILPLRPKNYQESAPALEKGAESALKISMISAIICKLALQGKVKMTPPPLIFSLMI